MSAFFQQIAWGVLVWQLASLALNVVLTWRTPEQWDAWVKKTPRLAGVVYITRALGWDIPGLLRKAKKVVDLQAGKAPVGAGLLSPLPDAVEKALQNPALARELEASAAKLLAAVDKT